MPEQTLNLPLNGSEVIESVLDRIRQSLRKDCYLSETKAYDFFTGHVSIQGRLHDVGRTDEINQEIEVTIGTEPDGSVETFDASIDIDARPPNTVRVESGQGVPVSTTENGKPAVKKIRYARDKAKAK